MTAPRDDPDGQEHRPQRAQHDADDRRPPALAADAPDLNQRSDAQPTAIRLPGRMPSTNEAMANPFQDRFCDLSQVGGDGG